MNRTRPAPEILGALALGAALPTVIPALAGRSAAPEPLGWGLIVTTWLFFVLVLLGTEATRPQREPSGAWRWPLSTGLLVAITLFGGLGVVLRQDDLSAWLLAGGLFTLLLNAAAPLSAGRPWAVVLLVRGLLALAAGFALVALTELETRFADEEFFVALQALLVALEWFLLSLAWDYLAARRPPRPATAGRGPALGPRWIAVLLSGLILALFFITVRQYQRSFYSPQAPTFTGISREAPFHCYAAPTATQTYGGTAVFQRLLDNVAANPGKGTPEFGMLALGSGEEAWAQEFHRALLDEARQGLFTGPANSFKYIQFEAALRAYYYPRVLAVFPGLFSPAEQGEILAWFQAVNRRALTTEWVDWNYGLAFAKRPQGPYENQENGAGLLALLETHDLGDPALAAQNRAYLDANPRGWTARFTNTDDAYIYQIEWIYNALFQAAFTGDQPDANTRLAFEWLLLQALPDGAPLRYNHPVPYPLAGPAYAGANLLNDGRYVWLAGRSLDYMEANGLYAPAAPGAEFPLDLEGTAPAEGDCLLFGDSGLPNQRGPLAPDKTVLRQGWEPDDLYLLLNLRFSGWHRYKATNTLTLAYRETPLVIENTGYDTYAWLPVGRSVARDKRLPRENLNGLAIERSGLSRVLYALTGVGGPWAQDPPYYAEVVEFTQTPEFTLSHTRLAGWRGWEHDRRVYRFEAGPAVVYDRAYGLPEKAGAFNWHLAGPVESLAPDRLRFSAPQPFEIVLLPLSPGELATRPFELPDQASGLNTRFSGTERLELVTVLLPGEWAGAHAEVQTRTGEQTLVITGGPEDLTLPLPPIP